MKRERVIILAYGAALLAGLLDLWLPMDEARREGAPAIEVLPGSPRYQPFGGSVGTLEAAGWTGPRLGAARRIISSFFTALAHGRIEEARIHLHPEMNPLHLEALRTHLKHLELLTIGSPSFHPDGESVFFPVVLRTVVGEGAPAGWETGIATHYLRLRLVDGEPRLAEITEGP